MKEGENEKREENKMMNCPTPVFCFELLAGKECQIRTYVYTHMCVCVCGCVFEPFDHFHFQSVLLQLETRQSRSSHTYCARPSYQTIVVVIYIHKLHPQSIRLLLVTCCPSIHPSTTRYIYLLSTHSSVRPSIATHIHFPLRSSCMV